MGVGSKKNEGKFTFTVNENLHSLQCTGSLISSNENRRICDERKIPNQEKKECKFKKELNSIDERMKSHQFCIAFSLSHF